MTLVGEKQNAIWSDSTCKHYFENRHYKKTLSQSGFSENCYSFALFGAGESLSPPLKAKFVLAVFVHMLHLCDLPLIQSCLHTTKKSTRYTHSRTSECQGTFCGASRHSTRLLGRSHHCEGMIAVAAQAFCGPC